MKIFILYVLFTFQAMNEPERVYNELSIPITEKKSPFMIFKNTLGPPKIVNKVELVNSDKLSNPSKKIDVESQLNLISKTKRRFLCGSAILFILSLLLVGILFVYFKTLKANHLEGIN